MVGVEVDVVSSVIGDLTLVVDSNVGAVINFVGVVGAIVGEFLSFSNWIRGV